MFSKILFPLMIVFVFTGRASAMHVTHKGILETLEGNFDEHKTKVRNVKASDDLFFNLTGYVEKINEGDTIINGRLFSKKEFENANHLDELKSLAGHVDTVLENDKYSHIFISKQAYLMRGVDKDHLGTGDDLFTKTEFLKYVQTELKFKFPEEETDHSWITKRDLPRIWGVISGPMIGKTYHKKIYKGNLDEKQKKILTALDKMGVPEIVAVTSTPSPKLTRKGDFELSEKDHTVRGISSITYYYAVNQSRDLLVITYQLAKIDTYNVLGSILDKVSGLFLNGTAASIEKTREFFHKGMFQGIE